MSVTAAALFEAQYAPASLTTVYTSQAGTTTIVDKFTVTNITGGNVNLTVCIVGSGGTAGSSNAILDVYQVDNNLTVDLSQYLQHVLGPGDFISVLSSAASSLVIRGSGRQVI